MSPNAAFLYDFLQVPGGAEQMALHVHRKFDEIDFTFGFIDHCSFPEESFTGSRIQALTSASKIPGWQGIKTMSAFERKSAFLQNYQTVIYSGVYAPVAIKHHSKGRNIYYCHTPPRFVYDLRGYYAEQASIWQKPLLNFLIRYVRPRYEKALRQMDVIVANSSNVQARLQKYLGISNATVIYPPVDTDKFSCLGQGDYYLSTARLEPYKRVEFVIRAFMQMPEKKLVVASGGSDMLRLKKLSTGHKNITFIGWCNLSELQQQIGNCIATIYMPHDEDFGMSPVESMAAGKPVIGVAEGGLLESVVHNETGLLVDPVELGHDSSVASYEGIKAIIKAIYKMDPATALGMRSACEKRATLFSSMVFDKKFKELLYM